MTEKEIRELFPFDYFKQEWLICLPKERQEREVERLLKERKELNDLVRFMAKRPAMIADVNTMHTMDEVRKGFYRL